MSLSVTLVVSGTDPLVEQVRVHVKTEVNRHRNDGGHTRTRDAPPRSPGPEEGQSRVTRRCVSSIAGGSVGGVVAGD